MAGDLPYRHCAGIVLLDGRGGIFAAQRIDMPGAWQMPQGGIDKGESPRQAALRELQEEIGTARARIVAETAGWLTYDLPPELLGKALKGRYRGQKQKWFAMAFEGSDADIDIHGVPHPELDAWRWMAPDAILAAIVPFKRDVYDAVFAEFAALIGSASAR